MRAARVPGVGIVLFAHGEPVYMRAYGMRDTERRLPLTVDSVMTAASLTKAAFAYLVMQLVDAALTSPKRRQPHTRRASGHPGAVSARQPAPATAPKCRLNVLGTRTAAACASNGAPHGIRRRDDTRLCRGAIGDSSRNAGRSGSRRCC
jgi:hypothetical protein